MTPITIHARIIAERALIQGNLGEALLTIEAALLAATPEDRAELEEARDWLEDMLPVARPTWPPAVGEA